MTEWLKLPDHRESSHVPNRTAYVALNHMAAPGSLA